MKHNKYPHEAGTLYDCTACESSCHCTAGHAECIYEGTHIVLEDEPVPNGYADWL